MQNTIVRAFAIVGSLAVAAAAGAQEKPRTPQTDRSVPVTKGSRLVVTNDMGEVVVRTWDRDTLRVQASHTGRTTIDVQTSAGVVNVRAKTGGGRASVDYEITTPSWMPVRISGQHTYIGIEGATSEVSAETVSGDVVIRGGSGTVTAKSIQGEVIVEDAKGRINASSVNEGVRISGGSGEIVAETNNGDISVSKVEAQRLELTTVNGDLRYEGTIASGAQYRMVTHNGDITLVLPETANATVSVRTYKGSFHSNLPAKPVGEIRRGRRSIYTLGTGGSDIDLETFNGTIRLRQPGTAPARGRTKEKEKDEQ